jgi:hypothetical protein
MPPPRFWFTGASKILADSGERESRSPTRPDYSTKSGSPAISGGSPAGSIGPAASQGNDSLRFRWSWPPRAPRSPSPPGRHDRRCPIPSVSLGTRQRSNVRSELSGMAELPGRYLPRCTRAARAFSNPSAPGAAPRAMISATMRSAQSDRPHLAAAFTRC